MEPNLGLKNEDKGDSYRLLNSMKVKTFCEPPGADPQAMVVVCHENRVGLFVTVIEMEVGPPVAASGSDHQTTVSCVD